MTEMADRAAQAEDLYRTHTKRHKAIFADIVMERIRQESLWGVQEHVGDVWFRILAEEVGEIAHDLNELASTSMEDEAALIRFASNLREELVQTAAVAVAWLENWDREGRWS